MIFELLLLLFVLALTYSNCKLKDKSNASDKVQPTIRCKNRQLTEITDRLSHILTSVYEEYCKGEQSFQLTGGEGGRNRPPTITVNGKRGPHNIKLKLLKSNGYFYDDNTLVQMGIQALAQLLHSDSQRRNEAETSLFNIAYTNNYYDPFKNLDMDTCDELV